MSSISSDLMQFVWLALTIMIGALQIAASTLLLKEQHLGPWMMLAGAVLSLLANVVSHAMAILEFPILGFEHIEAFYLVVGGISSFGWLCFTVGLVLYAIHRRSQRERIAELERLVESQQG